MMKQHRLLITDADHRTLIRHFTGTADERMAFLYCGRTETSGRSDWLVRLVDLPRDDEYRRQGPARVTLRADAVVGRVLRAREATGFADVHSHPFSDLPTPSYTDALGAESQLRVLADLAPGTTLLRLIVGREGALFAEVYDAGESAWLPLSEIVVFGQKGRSTAQPVNAVAMQEPRRDRVDARTEAVVGPAHGLLRATRVLVIGAGGVGSAVAGQLAGIVNRIDIVDPDVVEIHNLPRLFHVSEADVGHPKAEVIAADLRRRFTGLRIDAHVGCFPDERSEEMFRAADVVFCCPDHHAVRWAAASLAARTMQPLIEVGCGGRRAQDGTITALGYHVRLQVPGGPCLACNGLDLSRLEDPSATAFRSAAGYIEGDDTIEGELVTLTTRAAADAVDVFLRYLTAYAGGGPGHLYFDALRFISLDLTGSIAPDPACTLCGRGVESFHAAGDVLNDDQRILTPSREVADASV